MTSEDILESSGFAAAGARGRLALRPLADRRRRDRALARDAGRRHAGDHRDRPQGLPGLARGSGAPAGRARAPVGEELRASKEALGALVTLEVGKIVSEGLGEVQEMIDICDFAVGLSRQLYGLAIASERPGHRMTETWHPDGAVRGHFRLQFSGRGLVVERGAGAGLRRSGDLEAVGKDAALGAGDDEDFRSRA